MNKRRRSPIFRLAGEIKLDADKKAVLPLSLDLQGVIEYLEVEDFLLYHFIITDPYHSDSLIGLDNCLGQYDVKPQNIEQGIMNVEGNDFKILHGKPKVVYTLLILYFGSEI